MEVSSVVLKANQVSDQNVCRQPGEQRTKLYMKRMNTEKKSYRAYKGRREVSWPKLMTQGPQSHSPGTRINRGSSLTVSAGEGTLFPNPSPARLYIPP